jgi:rare lipoprotein A
VTRAWIVLALLLSACSTPPVTEKPVEVGDSAPVQHIDAKDVEDAVPRPDPILAVGNKSPYTVLGVSYEILDDVKNYKEKGIASWYGTKFNGQKTSNGEIFDLYQATAAHKTLPIPTYVSVTNLKNQRSTIVRVNDRGPFKHGRLIDLSYAAATKLGYAKEGIAEVEVQIIDAKQYLEDLAQAQAQEQARKEEAAVKSLAGDRYIQAGAFKSHQSALNLQQQLQDQLDHPVVIRPSNDWFRVHIGPVVEAQLQELQGIIVALGLGITPVTVKSN